MDRAEPRRAGFGKQRIAFIVRDHPSQTEYLFTRLNAVNPEMIAEAAREVAQKFAATRCRRHRGMGPVS